MNMKILSTKVIPGCISCKSCENICPEVFKVAPTSKVISDKWNENALKVLMAAKMCPVQVIKVEAEGEYSLDTPEATLKSKTYLTPDTLELVFETKDFKFTPGQYISLQMKDIRGEFSRSYSIASGDKNSFTLTVKLLEKWRGSNFLRKLGEKKLLSFWNTPVTVGYLGGLGDFTLKDTPEKKVMIATGTGLAPMISMLEALPDETPKLLLFGGRYEKDLYYLEKLASFKNLEIVTCVSRPDENYTGDKGRVTDYLHKIHPEDEVYICGNPNMVHDTIKHLSENGHFREKIYHEDFTLATKPDPLWKIFLFEGNIPGINMLQNILIYSGIFLVPLVYYFAVQYSLLGTKIFDTTISDYFYKLTWIAVCYVIMIRPLADIFPKLGIFRRGVVLRKGFGIFSASIIVTILFAKWIQNPATFSAFFTANAWNLWYPLMARLSEVTGILLLITSNSFSQRKLWIWWKRIQRLSYVYFIAGGIIAARWSPDAWYYESMVIAGILWLVAALRIKLWK